MPRERPVGYGAEVAPNPTYPGAKWLISLINLPR
jgi:hypothetical protein